MSPRRLPTIITSSVIRLAQERDSHGGVYLVDLEDGSHEQVIDWDRCDIDWSGRGGSRGLRGIGIWNDTVLLAASDELFVYDTDFELLDSFRSPYLASTHETWVDSDRLLLTSTSFDSVLEFDLTAGAFSRGVCMRQRTRGIYRIEPWEFDPMGDDGPHKRDEYHFNSVSVRDGIMYVSGTHLKGLIAVDGLEASRYAPLPWSTHNARPHGEGVIFNDTKSDRVVVRDTPTHVSLRIDPPKYDEADLLNNDTPHRKARQGWARGLALHDGIVITGTSPAAIFAHDLDSGELVGRATITMDILNAIHGLEVWPF